MDNVGNAHWNFKNLQKKWPIFLRHSLLSLVSSWNVGTYSTEAGNEFDLHNFHIQFCYMRYANSEMN